MGVIHRELANSRRRRLLRRGHGAVRRGVQTRRLANGALPGLCEHVHLGGSDRVLRLCHADPAGECGGYAAADRRHVSHGTLVNPEGTYQPTERRPIASRETGWARASASWLSQRGVTANTISMAGMFAGIASGSALVATAYSPWPWDRVAWLAGALFAQLRLIANLLDGMVAIESGRASPVGELYNEVPDRISDSAILIGLGYAAGSWPML